MNYVALAEAFKKAFNEDLASYNNSDEPSEWEGEYWFDNGIEDWNDAEDFAEECLGNCYAVNSFSWYNMKVRLQVIEPDFYENFFHQFENEEDTEGTRIVTTLFQVLAQQVKMDVKVEDFL